MEVILSWLNLYFKQQFTSFSKSNRFLSLPLDHLLEILYWDDLAVSSEEVVFTAAIRWLTNEMERQKFAPMLENVLSLSNKLICLACLKQFDCPF